MLLGAAEWLNPPVTFPKGETVGESNGRKSLSQVATQPESPLRKQETYVGAFLSAVGRFVQWNELE